MRNVRPCIFVTYHNGQSERGRFFESFSDAERFMDWIEQNCWEIRKVELIKDDE